MLPELLSIETPSDDVCVFWFDGPEPYITSVSAVCRDGHCLVIDSYCGSYYMDIIRAELQKRFDSQRFSLINTHHHWDHIWGNTSFTDCEIYSTSLCRQNIAELWQEQMDENQYFFRGKETMILPTSVVDEVKEILPQIYAFPTPGHTMDSLSVWDSKNRILFAGDLVELPVVQLCHNNPEVYQKTLRHLQALNPAMVISGHCRETSPQILNSVLSYLEALRQGEELSFQDKTARETHQANLLLLS